LQFVSHVPPAKAGSGRKINGLSARMKSCPVTKHSQLPVVYGVPELN
jgi:hypothetical protein